MRINVIAAELGKPLDVFFEMALLIKLSIASYQSPFRARNIGGS